MFLTHLVKFHVIRFIFPWTPSSRIHRTPIISFFKNENSCCFIAKLLSMDRRTVFDTVWRFKDLDNVQDRPKTVCPATAVTPRATETISERNQRNPHRIKRKIKQDLQKSLTFVQKSCEGSTQFNSTTYSKCGYFFPTKISWNDTR